MANKLPIQPELFDILIEYFAKVESGEIDLTDPVAQASRVITFCQNFFLQFFDNFLDHEITSIGPTTKREAVAIRHALRSSAPTETIQLITWFEGFCDTYQDILLFGYGGGGSPNVARQTALRIYETTTKSTQLACFMGVKGFRDLRIKKTILQAHITVERREESDEDGWSVNASGRRELTAASEDEKTPF